MQYKILDCLDFSTPELLEIELNRLGKDGWEVCQAVGAGTRIILILKGKSE